MLQRLFVAAALMAASLPAQIYTVAANTETDSLDNTNGNKVVGARGRLHTFHSKGGQIYYSVSADARNWSAGVAIASGKFPAVAVASDGTIGVAFQENGGIRYTWCKPALFSACAAWSPSIAALPGVEPSLTAHQNTMHLAAGGGGIGFYTSFPANQTTDWGGMEWFHYSSGVCTNESVRFPAVTVRTLPIGAPEIRISYIFKQTDSGNCGVVANVVMVISKVRPSNGNWSPNSDLFDTVPDYNNMGQAHSLSATVNQSSQEVFIAASFRGANLDYTRLYRRTAAGVWQTHNLNAARTMVDIETYGPYCAVSLRVAYSVVGAGNFGPTSYRTGSWSGASPTLGAAVNVPGNGRAPQATFLRMNSNFMTANFLPILFTKDNGGGTTSIQEDSPSGFGWEAACLPQGGGGGGFSQ